MGIASTIGLGAVVAAAAGVTALVVHSARVARGVEAALPPTGRKTRVRGGTLHWTETGAGRPVLLIHGLGGNLLHFSDVVPLLADEFRVISVDRPGSGYSTRDSDDLATLPEQARMIAEFLATEGIEKPLIVGHSLGGALALTMALNHPEQVSALALLCPLTTRTATPAVFRSLEIRSPLVRRIIGATLAVPMAKKTAQETLRIVFAPEPAPEDFILRFGGALGLRPQAFVATSTDTVAASETVAAVHDRLATLTLPGGVQFGAEDGVLNPEVNGRGLQKILPHFLCEFLPDRGHMTPVTAPEDCAGFIRKIAALSGTRSGGHPADAGIG